jgi:hypothetical protein
MSSVISKLDDAVSVIDEAMQSEPSIPVQMWIELQRYLIIKRDALIALANMPLPRNRVKFGHDLHILCNVMNEWAKQRAHLIDALRAAEGEPPLKEGYTGKYYEQDREYVAYQEEQLRLEKQKKRHKKEK